MSIWDDTFELYGGGDRSDWNNPAVRAAWAAYDKDVGKTNTDAYNEFYGDNAKKPQAQQSQTELYHYWDNLWGKSNYQPNKLREYLNNPDSFDWDKWKEETNQNKDLANAEADTYGNSWLSNETQKPQNQADYGTATDRYWDTAKKLRVRDAAAKDENLANKAYGTTDQSKWDDSKIKWEDIKNYGEDDNDISNNLWHDNSGNDLSLHDAFVSKGVTDQRIRSNMRSMKELNALDQNNPLAYTAGSLTDFFIKPASQRNIPEEEAMYKTAIAGPGSLNGDAKLGNYANTIENDWSKYRRNDDPNTPQDESKMWHGQDILQMTQDYDTNTGQQEGQQLDAWIKNAYEDNMANLKDVWEQDPGRLLTEFSNNNLYAMNDLNRKMIDTGLLAPELLDQYKKGGDNLAQRLAFENISKNPKIAGNFDSLQKLNESANQSTKDEEGNETNAGLDKANAMENYGQALMNTIALASALGNTNNVENIIGAQGSGLRNEMLGQDNNGGLLNAYLNYAGDKNNKDYAYYTTPALEYDPASAVDEGFDVSDLKTLKGDPFTTTDKMGFLNGLQIEKALKKAGLKRRA